MRKGEKDENLVLPDQGAVGLQPSHTGTLITRRGRAGQGLPWHGGAGSHHPPWPPVPGTKVLSGNIQH